MYICPLFAWEQDRTLDAGRGCRWRYRSQPAFHALISDRADAGCPNTTAVHPRNDLFRGEPHRKWTEAAGQPGREEIPPPLPRVDRRSQSPGNPKMTSGRDVTTLSPANPPGRPGAHCWSPRPPAEMGPQPHHQPRSVGLTLSSSETCAAWGAHTLNVTPPSALSPSSAPGAAGRRNRAPWGQSGKGAAATKCGAAVNTGPGLRRRQAAGRRVGAATSKRPGAGDLTGWGKGDGVVVLDNRPSRCLDEGAPSRGLHNR